MLIVEFYLGHVPDHAGRLIAEIWSYTHDQLESHHDFIQWLFPLETASPVNPAAPTLDASTIREFRTRPRLRENLLRSFDLMLNFYGLEREAPLAPPAGVSDPSDLVPEIARAPNYADRAPNWLTPGNHNHLRLTRILHCLTLCGLEAEARALLAQLEQIARTHIRVISTTTLEYWRGAVS